MDYTILKQDANSVTYLINSCGHEKTSKRIPKQINCLLCKKRNNYLQKNIDIDYNNSKLTCTLCNRVYYRSKCKLTKDLNKFKCYCLLQRSSERLFFDEWNNNSGLTLYKSYNFYKTGVNHSSDFYCLYNGKTIIIHLDDDSHRCKPNRQNDIKKLLLTKDDPDIYNFYVAQRSFIDDPVTWIVNINQCIANIQNKVEFFTDDKKFYQYLLDVL